MVVVKEVQKTTGDIKKLNNCRVIKIADFRNIGVNNPAYITVNRSLDPERYGGLVIVVGPNNSGKSNVLDAIEALKTGVTEDDTPDFFSLDYSSNPEISLLEKGDETKVICSTKNTGVKKTREVSDLKLTSFELDTLDDICNSLLRTVMNSRKKTELNERASQLYPATSKNLMEASIWIYDNFEELNSYIDDEDCEFLTTHKAAILQRSRGTKVTENRTKDVPEILRYKEEQIKSSDLISPIKPFNQFMQNVLRMTFNGMGVKKVADAYERFKSGKTSAYLSKTEEVLIREAEAFSEQFNSLYHSGELLYSFKFRLMDDKISLEIYLGDEPLDLDRQSTGFKWFFNFFFNLLCSNTLKPGDIVIMDEPATNLHVSGQIELREFIRRFAINNGVSFVISTHSPFLINCDYLDELRIVSRIEDGTSTIYDKFTLANQNDPDQMDQILRSLTIGRHVIMNPKDRVYFVEGITDYNYLTAFKLYFGINDMTFLPINGLGSEKDVERRKKIVSELMKIDKKPTLIVDGDGAGKEMKELSKETGLEVICLTDIDSRFHTIESLFKIEDRDQFIPVKEWHYSSIFKQYINDIGPQLSEYTIDNFKKLFKGIE